MSDVSADVLAEGWVVPEDIAALSVFSFARCFKIECICSNFWNEKFRNFQDFSPGPLGFTRPSWAPKKILPSYGNE